ncbi:MAG: aldo/keto reductase [Anaerolineae bacterium]|nr:aldo/keto reductase [Anaerolineae bacterium]
MRYGNVPGIDKPISRLVQGTLMISPDKVEWGFDLLDSIRALGCTTFDTARVYGGGTNEGIVGKWVNSRGIRDQVVIIGKGAHPSKDNPKRVTPEAIDADIRKSLESFEFDYIDLYLLHRDDPEVPVGPIIDMLNEQKSAGRIHAFGGSNWSHERLQAANDYAAAHGLVPFACSSPNFSLAEQAQPPWSGCISISNDAAAKAWYQANQMPIFAWSSLAGGFFSGRFRRDNLTTFTDYFDALCATTYGIEPNFQRLERVQQLGTDMGLTVAQVAMAYVLNQSLNMYAIVGCNSAAEFQQNMDAMTLDLTPDRVAWLVG